MRNTTVAQRNDMFAAMSSGKPYKVYIKTILGKVFINYWDVYEDTPMGGLLEGDPRNKEQGSFIELFSEKEDQFFRRANKRHFDAAVLRELVMEEIPEAPKERTIAEYTDEEIKALVNSEFFKLQSVLNNTNSEAVVYRLLSAAKDEEKSEKIIKHIESRLSEIQEGNLPKPVNVLEEEL